ncbi:hypothetical protein HCU01_02230 [Halomonas cupida]|uniref:Uncharacterized protein n=1 Tax=Halomonas cupida TaxID=44933 RepID=A0ABQ0W9D5_9GAMM|nr:hypothetical protein HCU01_02230 [Halomonas cupida]
MSVWAAIGHGEAFLAELFQSVVAGLAVAAGIDHTANTDQITWLVLRDVVAHGSDSADDLVARYNWVGSHSPVISSEVQIAVADTAVEDIDRDIIGARRAALEIPQFQWRGG